VDHSQVNKVFGL